MIHIKHLCHALAEQKYILVRQTSRTNEKINKKWSTIQWWRAISSCLLCLSVLTISFLLISLFYEFCPLLLWYGSSMTTPRSSLSVCMCLYSLFQIQFINVGFSFFSCPPWFWVATRLDTIKIGYTVEHSHLGTQVNYWKERG